MKDISDKELVFRTHKELPQVNGKKTNKITEKCIKTGASKERRSVQPIDIQKVHIKYQGNAS